MVSTYLLFYQDSMRRANWKFRLVSSTETTWTVWPLCIPAGQAAHWPRRKRMSGSRSQTALGILPLLRPARKHKQTSAEIKKYFLLCVFIQSKQKTAFKMSRVANYAGTTVSLYWGGGSPLGLKIVQSLSPGAKLSLKVRARKSHVPVHFKSGQMMYWVWLRWS